MPCVTSFPPASKKELKRIIDEVDHINPVVARMLEFSTRSGLRYCDVSKLRVKDVYINGVIREDFVVIQQKPYNKRLSSGKAKASARELSKVEVHINEQGVEMIEDIMHLQNLDSIKNQNALLFESSRVKGKPYSNQYINQLLKKVAVTLKLNYPLSTHSFRKMFAKMYVENGAAIHQVRDGLGQSSLQATDHYLRTFQSETKKFSNRITF